MINFPILNQTMLLVLTLTTDTYFNLKKTKLHIIIFIKSHLVFLIITKRKLFYFLAMNDLVLSQHLIGDLTNTIENLTRLVNDIPVHPLVLRVLQDIVVINHQPITSMLQYL